MATVYINADSGNDSRSYAEAQVSTTPWLTPNKVFTDATDGDTCIVQTATATYTCSNATITKTLTFTGETTNNSNHVFAMSNQRFSFSTNSKTHTFNYIKFTGSGNLNAFYMYGTSATSNFNNCYFAIDPSTTTQSGVFRGSASPATFNLTNCVIVGITADANKNIFTEAGGFSPVFTITGCTIYTPVINTIFYAVNSSITATVKNTIIYATGAMAYKSGTVNTTATYSCFYTVTTPPTGTGVITSDPLFVDAINSNFNLRQTSPCISTGTLV